LFFCFNVPCQATFGAESNSATQAQTFLDLNTSSWFFFGNSYRIAIDAKNNLAMVTTTLAWAQVFFGTQTQDRVFFFFETLVELLLMLKVVQQWPHKPKLGLGSFLEPKLKLRVFLHFFLHLLPSYSQHQ
jgi:hypothetical protein